MKNYVVIGLETTGPNYKEEQIIEAAVIKYDANFKEMSSFHSMVCFNRGKAKPLSDYVKKLTGIKESDLINGMSEKGAILLINNFIDNDSVLVAQDASFDLAFLSKYDIYPDSYICTKSLTAQMEPSVFFSLKAICRRFCIQLHHAHRALADVQATTELLKYIFQLEVKYIENYLMKFVGREMNFIPANTIKVLDELEFSKEN
ncbi:PolC-type DNA polymerase III [Oceanobacillus oncorhynchi]|uniref:3'-5' exonuclease n=1 Tax=Oceanobacillus oncorhynchi TaxID=545501 RepID=UPI0018682796|nr:3'-5' exonuclease [Oceanobacillus oncorhynchi]